MDNVKDTGRFAMRIPLVSRSAEPVTVPPWWNVLCGALAIFLLALLAFQGE